MAWSKASRHARGYGYRWDKLRLQILERDGWLCQCEDCAKQLAPRPANQVNHKVSKADAKRRGWSQEQMDDPSNLEAVNADCHDRITKAQKGHRPRAAVGLDGWPIE